MSKFQKALLLAIILLVIDQIIKVWIKTNMTLGENIIIFGDWAKIHFTENKGMAFGMQFGGEIGKLLLSLFRIAAIIGIIWYLYDISKKKFSGIAIFSISLVLAGATGNIFDSAFYGVIFSESTFYQEAVFMPEAGGYAKFLHGSVVDMFYFPMIRTTYPEWVPFFGGSSLEFFRPVFNFADSCISVGVALIIIFRKKFIPKQEEPILEV